MQGQAVDVHGQHSTACPLHDLLNDNDIAEILSRLPLEDKQSVQAVCRRWQDVMIGSTYPVYGKLVFNLAHLGDHEFFSFCDWVGSRAGSICSLTLKSRRFCTRKQERMLEVYLGYLVGQIRTGELSLELNLQGAENFFTLACFREAAFLKQLGPTLTVIQLYGMLQCVQEDDVSWLGELHQLRELRICTSGFYARREGLGLQGSLEALDKLCSLQMLELFEHPQLQRLPASLGQLQCLDLYGCGQLHLDTQVLLSASQLQSLSIKHCDVSDATFEAAAGSWSALRHLTCIDIQDKHLSRLPAAIADLPTLQSLAVSSDTLVKDTSWMPDSYSSLTSLHTLRITASAVPVVPDVLCNLHGLTCLDFNNNQISVLPEAVSQLTGLQQLHLSANNFASVPEQLHVLTKLREIGLADQNCAFRITQPLDLPFVLPYLQRLELVQHDDQKLDHVSLCHIGEAVARLRRARRPVWLYVFHPNPETDDEAEEEDHEGDNDSDGYY